MEEYASSEDEGEDLGGDIALDDYDEQANFEEGEEPK